MKSQQQSSSPELRTITASGQRHGPMKTSIDVRDFNFIIDEPEKLGGKNEAPTPMEYVTGALGGCFNVTIEMITREFDFALADLGINCSGSVDRRGLFGTADVSPHFQNVKVDIRIKSNIPANKRKIFQKTCLKRCPVYNLIKDSGTPIQVNWNYLRLD